MTTEPSEEFVPSFSRDGRWIYFCSNRSSPVQIWKMPAEGGSAVQVTKGAASTMSNRRTASTSTTRRTWQARHLACACSRR
jgi:Tol biopolymer transport system component